MGLYDQLARPGSLWFESTAGEARYGDSLFFSDPLETLTLHEGDDIAAWFAELESRLHAGYCLAGWLGYEAGSLFDPALAGCAWPAGVGDVLGWFGVYRRPERFSREAVEAGDAAAEARSCAISGFDFEYGEAEYCRTIDRLRSEIAAGNVYQVNFTGRCRFSFEGAVEALYVKMKRRQPSPWSAFLNTGDRHILSFSPELFFVRSGRLIETMPMKGTAPRRERPDEDLAEKAGLSKCEKNRAENLMIVDLLRNDLGRICETGSVRASGLFETQSYPTLHQMVSTVRGELRDETRLRDLFRALFPSGSVTGAPKVRAMQLIRELEQSPRGVYTGAVGFMLPEGRMAFNVAIRTIELHGRSGLYGTGSGIVWDSDPRAEFRECMLKTRILADLATSPASSVPGIFETMQWNGWEYLLLGDHLDRLDSSATALGFTFSRDAIATALSRKARELRAAGGRHRVRLTLARDGSVTLISEPFSLDASAQPVRVCIAAERVDSRDPLLRHKSLARERYDRAYREAQERGFGEALFLNERGEVTEGAISNVLARIDGRWLTPPESSGLLNGVFRRYLLRTRPWIIEKAITLDELLKADMVLVCNALRGVRRAEILILE
ncbi:aminodeoxychorismate synthase, component I [Chlorobaculum limnaeum]|uniref:Aminodeoxychorismate synthase, component I n=1 Tax=Chlorobaculum limnaeum TaxID=274537 RepID=A0A1D8D4R5_CHLLM|nr:aminodeoxychorismate synthase component I [Chlorobaculum limnaeum]AOS84247.1 aminodeoxychorismate synthase, component I [Chlorobaculum limnaeum]